MDKGSAVRPSKEVVHPIKAYSHCSSYSWRATEATPTIHSDSPVWNSLQLHSTWNRATAACRQIGFCLKNSQKEMYFKIKTMKNSFCCLFLPLFEKYKTLKNWTWRTHQPKKPLIVICSTASTTIRKAILSPLFTPKPRWNFKILKFKCSSGEKKNKWKREDKKQWRMK